jgi:hypothetical protein
VPDIVPALPDGLSRGVGLRLAERNAYRTHSVLEPVNQLRVLVSRVASRTRDGGIGCQGARVFRNG